MPFYMGGTTFWMPKFDFAQFLEYNRSLGITTFLSVPPIYLLCAKSPLVKDHLRSLKAALGTFYLDELPKAHSSLASQVVQHR
jgi:hypothetical protein